LERKEREMEDEGGKRERAESRREKTEKRRDERGSGRRRDKVTGTDRNGNGNIGGLE
jgi:hypothetical protein